MCYFADFSRVNRLAPSVNRLTLFQNVIFLFFLACLNLFSCLIIMDCYDMILWNYLALFNSMLMHAWVFSTREFVGWCLFLIIVCILLHWSMFDNLNAYSCLIAECLLESYSCILNHLLACSCMDIPDCSNVCKNACGG
jgi:hypothetical protein